MWSPYEQVQTQQESRANAKVSARQPCWPKTDFDMKYSHSFWVIHFAISCRPTRAQI